MDARAICFSVAVAFLYVLANVLTEKSLEPGRSHYMGYVCCVAIVAFFGFRWTCQQFGLAVASAVVDSLLTLLTVAYAVFVLKDTLSTVQYLGLSFLLVGLLLLKGPWSGGEKPEMEPSSTEARQEASP